MPTLVNFFPVWLQQSLSHFCFNLFMVSLSLLFNRDFSFEAKEETDSNTGNEGSRPEGKREIYLYILPQFPLLLRKKERKHKFVKAACVGSTGINIHHHEKGKEENGATTSEIPLSLSPVQSSTHDFPSGKSKTKLGGFYAERGIERERERERGLCFGMWEKGTEEDETFSVLWSSV